MIDYSISWAYICKKMEEKYGMSPDSIEKHPMGVIEEMIKSIWSEYFEKVYEYEQVTMAYDAVLHRDINKELP